VSIAPITAIATGDAIDSTAHIVQVALTPIFLLTGAGTLLNVFNTRLSRVSDHTEHTAELLKGCEDDAERRLLESHLTRLRHRLLALDASILLISLGGAATCGTACILFLGGVQDKGVASWLVISFALALVCVVGGLAAFLVDTLLAWHGIRRDAAASTPTCPSCGAFCSLRCLPCPAVRSSPRHAASPPRRWVPCRWSAGLRPRPPMPAAMSSTPEGPPC
jgi:hypothetical protein